MTTITFKRDSVCASDDVLAPNAKTFIFPGQPKLSTVLAEDGPLLGYLPCVGGTTTLWKATVAGDTVAEVAFTCEPVRAISVELLTSDSTINVDAVFFKASGQQSNE